MTVGIRNSNGKEKTTMKLNDLFNENEIEIVEIIATAAKEKTIKDINLLCKG